MGGNHFYSNAEAYAYEILHQKLMKEAQRKAQQTVMELSALRTLFNQGQFIYCIPFNGTGFMGQNIPFTSSFPCPNFSPVDMNFLPPDPYFISYPGPAPPPPPLQPLPPPQPPPINTSPSPCAPPHQLPPSHNLLTQTGNNNITNNNISNKKQTKVHVNLKNHPKHINPKSGTDECNLGKDGIEVTIDLKEYIPAEISVNVEERSIEIKAYHVNEVGSKTFARRYDLPACIVLDTVKCVLSHDGYLLLSACWMKME